MAGGQQTTVKTFLTDAEMEAMERQQQSGFVSDAEMAKMQTPKAGPDPSTTQTISVPGMGGGLPIPRDFVGKLKNFLQVSPRTALRAGGAMIGGAVGAGGGTLLGTPLGAVPGGALGGAAGASIGESVYQLGNRMLGNTADLPQTGPEASNAHVEAIAQGAFQEGAPLWIQQKFPAMLKEGAMKRIAEATRPATEGEKDNVAKVAGELIRDFPMARTTQGLLSKFKEKGLDARYQLERAYNAAAQAGGKFSSQPVIDDIVAARNKLTVDGQSPPGTEAVLKALDDTMKWFEKNPEFTIESLRKNKQIWDRIINWNRGALSKEPATEEAFKIAAGSIRNMIHEAYPDTIAKADSMAHAWATMNDVLGRANTQDVGRISSHLGALPAGGLGGAIGYAAGGPPGGAIGTAIGIALRELPKTTLWQTASVAARAAAITALQRGDVELAVRALSIGVPAEMMPAHGGPQ